MKLVETTVTEGTVRMRYADDADPAKAKAWIDIQAPIAKMKVLSDSPLGDPDIRRLALVRLATVRYAQGVIDDEIRRLAELVNQRP